MYQHAQKQIISRPKSTLVDTSYRIQNVYIWTNSLWDPFTLSELRYLSWIVCVSNKSARIKPFLQNMMQICIHTCPSSQRQGIGLVEQPHLLCLLIQSRLELEEKDPTTEVLVRLL